MNDELQGVLAELASGLGTTTGELWTWLQGNGIEAYATAKVAQLWPPVIFFSLLTLLILAGMVYSFVKASKSEYFDVADILLCLFVPGIILLFTGGVAIYTVSDLLGWMTSPQGMVISMLLSKLGG